MSPRLTSLLILLLASSAAFAAGGRNRLVGSDATLRPVHGKIVADGDLSEWEESQATSLLLNDPASVGDSAGVFAGYSAKLAFRYDSEALYLAVWWKDLTPLGPELTPGCTPPGDGLILTVPGEKPRRVALWRVPPPKGHSPVLRSAVARAEDSLAEARPVAGLTQGYKLTGKTTYTQEARLPWAALGTKPPATGALLRFGVDLCFGGLDPAAGYRQFVKEPDPPPNPGNRWGGGRAWGFTDGIVSRDDLQPTSDPYGGALVTLSPARTAAPPNPPVMYAGNEITRTTAMVATPVVRVTVDGRLDAGEWDPESGTVIAYEPTLLPDRYAARIMWQYATEGLYVGLRWYTGGPQFNVNDPARLDHGYDGGDALQLHLGTNRASHLEVWRWTEGKQPTPALAMVYGVHFEEGKLGDALAEEAEPAFANLDGGGYTEEIFLPWKLITTGGAPLKEGDSFHAGLELYYSGLEGNRVPFIVAAKVAPPGE